MSRRGATRVMGTVLEGAVRAAVSCKEENGDPQGSRLSWLFPEPNVREAGPGQRSGGGIEVAELEHRTGRIYSFFLDSGTGLCIRMPWVTVSEVETERIRQLHNLRQVLLTVELHTFESLYWKQARVMGRDTVF